MIKQQLHNVFLKTHLFQINVSTERFFVHIRKQIKVRKYNVLIAAVFGGWHLMNLFVIKACKKIVDIVDYLPNKMACQRVLINTSSSQNSPII